MAPAVASNGPRYAPDDPTLPKPWKGLIDGSTGYLYYWNPETNVTQYDRPVSGTLPPPPPGPPPGPPPVAAISSSVQVQQQRRSSNDDDGRHAGSRSHQHQSTKVHGHSVQNSRTSVRGHGSSDMGGGSSAEAYRRQHEITVTGNDIPAPYTTFESAGFSSEILKEVHHAGFSAPTPIQAQSWPIVIKGRDIVAIAKTGSGKTLGYLIPGFIHIKNLRNNSKMGPTVLVLAPTRELATQIQDEADKFCRSSRISCTCVYGGAPKGPQLRDLDRGVDVVVATPGRLNDILEMRKISLRQVSYLVLDEADRMLDMGFEPQIRKIVKEIPHRRQTLMFTATWPKEVRKIAADLLASPVQVNIGGMGELVANKAITQHVEVITPMEKQRRLEQILRAQEPGSKVIIFCSTKRMCDQLSRTLTRRFGAASIHGDKSQVERDRVLGQFRTGKSPILVATDVAARGLDIKDIRVVINYDFPTGVEDYVHRIGRTGRAGATGESYTFFCDQDSKYASDLVKILEGASQHVPPELRGMVRGGRYGGGKSRRRWRSTSGTRDGGRSQGGRNDSSYGGRGGRGPQPSAGRSDNSRGGRGHSDNEPRDRYDRGPEVDARSRHDTSDRKTRGRGRSRSPSPKRGRVGRGSCRSRSRSRSWDHGRSRSKSCSRSRSHSPSVRRGLKKRGRDVELTRGQSPPPKRKEPPIDNNHHDRDPVHSPSPYYDQQQPEQQRSPPNSGGDSMREEGRHDRSPSPWEKQSRSPYDYKDNNGGLGQSASPSQWDQKRSPSPHYHPDEAEEPTKGPVRLPAKFPDNGEEEEEGMIPAEDEEDGMIPPEETGRASSGIVTAQEPNACADGEPAAL